MERPSRTAAVTNVMYIGDRKSVIRTAVSKNARDVCTFPSRHRAPVVSPACLAGRRAHVAPRKAKKKKHPPRRFYDAPVTLRNTRALSSTKKRTRAADERDAAIVVVI